MSLAKLTDVLVKFDERLSNIEQSIQTIEGKVRDIAGAVGTPTGELSFKGMLNPSPDTLKRALNDKASMELECVELEATFSHALYMGIAPDNREKIRELLAPEQINYLVNALECHKQLNELAGWAEDFRKNAAERLEEQKQSIRSQIERNIIGGRNSVVEKLQLTESRLKAQEDRIDTALRNLKEEQAKLEAFKAEAGNIIKNSKPSANKIFSVGAKKS